MVNIESFSPTEFQNGIAAALGLYGFEALRVHTIGAFPGSTVAHVAILGTEYVSKYFALSWVLDGPSVGELAQRLVMLSRDSASTLSGLGLVRVQPAPSAIRTEIDSASIFTDGNVDIAIPACSALQSCSECLA